MKYFLRVKKRKADTGGFPVLIPFLKNLLLRLYDTTPGFVAGQLLFYYFFNTCSGDRLGALSLPFYNVCAILAALSRVGVEPVLKRDQIPLAEAQPHSYKHLDIFLHRAFMNFCC